MASFLVLAVEERLPRLEAVDLAVGSLLLEVAVADEHSLPGVAVAEPLSS
jgi:hypothetical protein